MGIPILRTSWRTKDFATLFAILLRELNGTLRKKVRDIWFAALFKNLERRFLLLQILEIPTLIMISPNDCHLHFWIENFKIVNIFSLWIDCLKNPNSFLTNMIDILRIAHVVVEILPSKFFLLTNHQYFLVGHFQMKYSITFLGIE